MADDRSSLGGAPQILSPAAVLYDGHSSADLARILDVPRVELLGRTASTLDVAHALAATGAPLGTLVLADEQTAGRGRSGKPWISPPGAGIWLTLVERPPDAAAMEVLSVRLGIAAARVLDGFAVAPVRLKWPNDIHAGAGKLAGILLEARWREGAPEWVAVGFGLNVLAPPDVPRASRLREGVSRVPVLAELVPALRAAAALAGPLSPQELDAFARRDLALGRRCSAPAAGVVSGITPRGELRIALPAGERTFRAGSLVLLEDG